MCECTLIVDPFLACNTISIIESGDELLWSRILLIISVVWASISQALLDVFGCQVVGLGAGGVGVRGFTSSFDSTTSGSSRTKPVAQKLDVIFPFKNAFSNTYAKAARKAFLSIWLMWLSAKTLISFLYACFKGVKQPTSSGCRICDECGGI